MANSHLNVTMPQTDLLISSRVFLNTANTTIHPAVQSSHLHFQSHPLIFLQHPAPQQLPSPSPANRTHAPTSQQPHCWLFSASSHHLCSGHHLSFLTQTSCFFLLGHLSSQMQCLQNLRDQTTPRLQTLSSVQFSSGLIQMPYRVLQGPSWAAHCLISTLTTSTVPPGHQDPLTLALFQSLHMSSPSLSGLLTLAVLSACHALLIVLICGSSLTPRI